MKVNQVRFLGIPIYEKRVSDEPTEAEKRSTLAAPSADIMNAFGGVSLSGSLVTQDTALTFSAVWACVRILSNTVAMPPLSVFRKTASGGREKDENHPIHQLIHDEPNPIMGSFTWRQVMQSHATLKGNAYSIIHRDAKARPAELELIQNPGTVQAFTYKRNLFYKVVGSDTLIPAADMFHIRGLSFDGIMGKSVLQVARESIGTALAMQEYGNKLFKTGGSRRMALQHDGILKKDVKDNLSESWGRIYGNPENSHKVAILEGGVKAIDVGISPEDAQFIMSRRFSVEEIARYFGMVLDLMATDNKQTYASVEQRAIDFIKYTMMPWYTTWESEINRKLFRVAEKKEYYAKFTLDALLRGDTTARAQFYKDMFYIGALNRDEIRALEDRNEIPDGDQYYLQVNLDKAQNIGKDENK